MRLVTYGGACSLDGFIAGPNGEADWITFSREVGAIMEAYWAGIDTLLMGRRTWEVAQSYSGGSDPGMSGIRSYVFSRTLSRIDQPGVTLVREDAAAFVKALKRKPGKGICVFGGGVLAQSLLAGGVIDEIGFTMQPVILGRGIPGIPDPGSRVSLRLAECRELSNGCVYLRYRVKHRR